MRVFLTAFAVGLLPWIANADPVTWTFYETSCTANGGPAGNCSPAAPLDLADLTLPDSGAAAAADVRLSFEGTPDLASFTGTGWNLTIHDGVGRVTLEPDTAPYFSGAAGILGTLSFTTVPNLDFEWFQSTILVSLSIGDTRGTMSSLGSVANCPFDSFCSFTGEWTLTAVPEPPTLPLLAAALTGIWLIRRHGPVSAG